MKQSLGHSDEECHSGITREAFQEAYVEKAVIENAQGIGEYVWGICSRDSQVVVLGKWRSLL